jgi:hypothetical protein
MTVIDQIRAILKGRAAISREMLEPLVAEYLERVVRVNERLQRCESLLRKGLRSEAIQFADLEPRLLDEVALLDFPELEDWEEILRFYGLDVPASLLLDSALQLQDAMLSEQPLNAVLKQHRRLAIARAPLSWRLRILRQIERLDPGNPNWGEDIESWEKVRLKELDREVDEAIQKGNSEALLKLREELGNERWVIKPPDGLVNRIEAKIKSLRVVAAQSQLHSLAEQLNQAFCEMDSNRGKSLAQQWKQVSACVSQIPSECWQMAEPALAWIEEMERDRLQREEFDLLSQRLRESLNEQSKVADVMRLHQALVRMEMGVEASLERLYQNFLENRRIEGQRRTRLAMAGLVGSLAITAGVIGFFLWQRSDRNRELEVVGQLEQLVNEGKFEEANRYIEEMNSRAGEMMGRPSITKLVGEVRQWFVKEADRVRQFEDYLVRADNTDDAQLDLNAVVQAERLARSESEKGRAFALRKRHTEWERSVAEKQRSDAEGELKSVVSSISRIEAQEALDVDSDELARLRKRLVDIALKYPKCGDVILGEVKLVEKQLADLAESVRAIKNRMQLGERLLQAVSTASSPERLAAALQEFNTRVTGVALNTEFDAVLAEVDAWTVADKWNRWAVGFGAVLKNSVDSADAIRLVTVWNEEIKGVQGFPPSALYPQVVDELSLIEGRKGLLETYRNTLTDSLWSGFGTVVIEEGTGKKRRFTYASKEKDILKKAADYASGKTVGIEVVVEKDGTYGNWGPKGPFVYVPEPHLSVESILAELERKVPNFQRNWEREWLAQMARVIKDSRIDVVVKEEILLGMLDTMQKGTLSLKPMCDGAIEELLSRNRTRENWFEALDYDTGFDDSVTQQLQEGFRKIVERDVVFNKMSGTRISYAGVVMPIEGSLSEKEGGAVVLAQSGVVPTLGSPVTKHIFVIDKVPPNADLVYFYKDGVALNCGIIGTIKGGSFQVNADSLKAIPCGTPVFVVTSPQ